VCGLHDENALNFIIKLKKADNDLGVYALLILLGGTLDMSHAILERAYYTFTAESDGPLLPY
jgi:hypothetical protein